MNCSSVSSSAHSDTSSNMAQKNAPNVMEGVARSADSSIFSSAASIAPEPSSSTTPNSSVISAEDTAFSPSPHSSLTAAVNSGNSSSPEPSSSYF